MTEQDIRLDDLQMNAADLYREEVVTDRRVGSLRIMHPIHSDGTADDSRKTLYVGQSQIMTPMGALPLTFEIDADSLLQAIEQYATAAKQAIEHTMQELQEIRRQAASSIVLPDGPGGMGGGTGGLPGGGFKLP